MRYLASLSLGMVAVVALGCDQPTAPVDTVVPDAYLAGGWDEKVAGGGEAVAGGIIFHFSIAASGNADGGTGQMQYWRDANGGVDALSFHADVTCLWVAADLSRAAAAGPIKTVQEDPGGQAAGKSWAWAEVREGGTSAGDQVSVNLGSSDPGGQCGANNSTPGTYTDGNINIRSK